MKKIDRALISGVICVLSGAFMVTAFFGLDYGWYHNVAAVIFGCSGAGYIRRLYGIYRK